MTLAGLAGMRASAFVTRHYGVLLPAVVLSLILVILIPLPTGVMDFLLLVNVTLSGIVLLAMYYLSHPPFVGLQYSLPMEGNYLVVNKVLIELVAMVVLLIYPTGRVIGIDRLIIKRNANT